MKGTAAGLKRLSLVMAGVFGFMTVAVPVAQAGMIAPSSYGQAENDATSEQRQQLHHFLERDDVRAQLIDLGVNPAEAQARVDRLSDQEVMSAAQRMQQLPAGGDAVAAVALLFVVLIITDILGYTDIFTFIRK